MADKPTGTFQRRHGADTGFRDIKIPDEFFPKLWELYPLREIGGGLLVVILIWKLLRRKKRKVQNLSTPLSVHDQFKLGLAPLHEEIRSGKIETRESIKKLSSLYRRYLSERFRYPALEFTRSENREEFPRAIRAKLPNLPRDSQSDITRELHEILLDCEKLIFGAENASSSSAALSALERVRSHVEELEKLCRREEDRTQSVVPSRDGGA